MKKIQKDFGSKLPIRVTQFWGTDANSKTLIFNAEDFKIKFFQLNKLATIIWTLCDGKNRVDTISANVINLLKFKGIGTKRSEKINKEVLSFISELEKEGLITFKD